MNSGKIEKLQRILIQIYLILLCGGLPLFYVRTYAGIGTWKWCRSSHKNTMYQKGKVKISKYMTARI